MTLLFTALQVCKANGSVDSLGRIWKNEKEPIKVRFKALNEAYLSMTEHNPTSSIALSEYHYRLAKSQKQTNEMCNALNERAYAHLILGHVDSAMLNLDEVAGIYLETKDTLNRAKILTNKGMLYLEENMFKEAIDCYNKGLALLEQSNLSKQQKADILNNLGMIYFELGMTEMAEEYMNMGLKLYIEIGDEASGGNSLLNLGVIKYSVKDYNAAIDYLKQALPKLEASNNTVSTIDCLLHLSLTYAGMGKNEEALDFIKQNLALQNQVKNPARFAKANLVHANLLLDSNLEQALAIGNEMLALSKTTSDQEVQADTYELLYKCYKRKGNAILALQMLEMKQLYADSIAFEKNSIALARDVIKSDYQVKLIYAKLEAEKQQEKLRFREMLKRYSILTVAVLLLGALLLYIKRSIRKEAAIKESLLAEIARLKAIDHSTSLQATGFALNRQRIEDSIGKKLNETDWEVLNLLLAAPVSSNKDLATQAFKSVDGIGSSLRRMYQFFDIQESKYMKISLLMEVIKRSSNA